MKWQYKVHFHFPKVNNCVETRIKINLYTTHQICFRVGSLLGGVNKIGILIKRSQHPSCVASPG